MEDIDIDSLNRYRQLFKLSSPDHPWLALNDIDLLKMLGGYRKDRQSGEEGFTVAGLLMFGKTLSITDEECCPHFYPDYQERLTEKTTFVGPTESAQMEHGRQIYSTSISAFCHACNQCCQSHSSWKTTHA